MSGKRITGCERWGLNTASFARRVSPKQRGVIYSRDFSPSSTRLADLRALERCLIFIEFFAYPYGPKGPAGRVWRGLGHAPLVPWAGLCTADDCAGVLVRAPEALIPLTDAIPLLVTPEDCGRWLAGAPLLSLDPCFDEGQVYAEYFGERWASGRTADDMQLRFAA